MILTPQQAWALHCVRLSNGRTRRSNYTPGDLSGRVHWRALDGLERAGLVRRAGTHYHLTVAGERAIAGYRGHLTRGPAWV